MDPLEKQKIRSDDDKRINYSYFRNFGGFSFYFFSLSFSPVIESIYSTKNYLPAPLLPLFLLFSISVIIIIIIIIYNM
jgi:hypothetical protein